MLFLQDALQKTPIQDELAVGGWRESCACGFFHRVVLFYKIVIPLAIDGDTFSYG